MSRDHDTRQRALVVASWFPAIDDTTRGRFVADQVEALAASGRVDPYVLSFDTVALAGSRSYRQLQVGGIRSAAAAIVRGPALWAMPARHDPRGVPVARLPVPGGWKGVVGDHPVRERELAFGEIERLGLSWDIVHAHTGIPDAAGVAAYATGIGVPLLITEHSSFLANLLRDPHLRAAYGRAVAAAARVVAVSRTLGTELAAEIPGLAGKLVVIPNAVDTDAFRPVRPADRRADELLYVGYRRETKGIEVLLRAFALVRAARPSATLRLIGRSVDEATEDRWHRLAAELDIADAVAFDPPALRPAVAEAMGRASLLVHASPRETFGITAVEALASGTPVVAVDSGGVTETIGGDPALGIIVPPGDPAAFADAVLRTLERRASFDPGYLRASAVDRFRASVIAGRLADLYEQVTAEARPIGGPATSGGSIPARLASAASRAAPSVAGAAASGAIPVSAGAPAPALPPASPVLVVGFTTHRTARLLHALPPDLRARLHVLCADGESVVLLPDDVGSVTPVDLEGPYRGLDPAAGPGGRSARVRAALRDPVGAMRRRILRARADRFRTDAARAAVEAGVARLAGPSGPPDVVAVDGLDYLVISLVPAVATRPISGSIRRLGDALSTPAGVAVP